MSKSREVPISASRQRRYTIAVTVASLLGVCALVALIGGREVNVFIGPILIAAQVAWLAKPKKGERWAAPHEHE